jgi:hypothetical protein
VREETPVKYYLGAYVAHLRCMKRQVIWWKSRSYFVAIAYLSSNWHVQCEGRNLPQQNHLMLLQSHQELSVYLSFAKVFPSA